MDEHTEAPAPGRVIDGEATPVPSALFWILWLGAFAAMIWGMSSLLGRFRSRPERDEPPPEE